MALGFRSMALGIFVATMLLSTNLLLAFDSTIAPLLAKHCLECHSAATAEGGLDLSSRGAAIAGGDSGAAIVPSRLDDSLVWQMIDSDEMPKDRPPLSSAEKELVRKWIASGAEWTSERIDPLAWSSERRAGYDWWSIQPVKKRPYPAIRNRRWSSQGIDPFILAKLEQNGLAPSPEADRRTLIRRVTFDLIGLTPTPAEVDAFVQDRAPDAYAKVVDRLLDSPHYGERWARHWLDVVRFGETQGYERNRIRENAWQYRDFVIRAFNQDMPYDEFVRLQIAGDVIAPDNFDAMMATGYHVCGTWDQVGHVEGSETMRTASRWDHMEDLVGTLSQAYLGLTVNCSRCHDHKYDPISIKDYYQLAATLGGVTQEEKERSGIKVQPQSRDGSNQTPPNDDKFNGNAHIIIPKQPPTYHVLKRGDFRLVGDVVEPRGIAALARAGLSDDFGLKPDAPESERRLALAGWITDPKNPLTARVFVNRLWHHHFGRGIVDTPSDFGFSGGRPSHPELLDWLAARFVEGGWKVKPLHRILVLSSTYRQQSNVSNPEAMKLDSDNRLLWRANVRRLEGEAIRDAALAAAGVLNTKLGGPSFLDMNVKKENNSEFTTANDEFNENTNRRSIYRLWARSGNNPLLQAFDCPDPSVMAPTRTRTITPIQAMLLMNNARMERCAQELAKRLRSNAGDDPNRQIELAFELLFARKPRPVELAKANEFLAKDSLDQLCLVLLNTNEFSYVN